MEYYTYCTLESILCNIHITVSNPNHFLRIRTNKVQDVSSDLPRPRNARCGMLVVLPTRQRMPDPVPKSTRKMTEATPELNHRAESLWFIPFRPTRNSATAQDSTSKTSSSFLLERSFPFLSSFLLRRPTPISNTHTRLSNCDLSFREAIIRTDCSIAPVVD